MLQGLGRAACGALRWAGASLVPDIHTHPGPWVLCNPWLQLWGVPQSWAGHKMLDGAVGDLSASGSGDFGDSRDDCHSRLSGSRTVCLSLFLCSRFLVL